MLSVSYRTDNWDRFCINSLDALRYYSFIVLDNDKQYSKYQFFNISHRADNVVNGRQLWCCFSRVMSVIIISPGGNVRLFYGIDLWVPHHLHYSQSQTSPELLSSLKA